MLFLITVVTCIYLSSCCLYVVNYSKKDLKVIYTASVVIAFSGYYLFTSLLYKMDKR